MDSLLQTGESFTDLINSFRGIFDLVKSSLGRPDGNIGIVLISEHGKGQDKMISK